MIWRGMRFPHIEGEDGSTFSQEMTRAESSTAILLGEFLKGSVL